MMQKYAATKPIFNQKIELLDINYLELSNKNILSNF